jgi:chorismate-pyruvate lyase
MTAVAAPCECRDPLPAVTRMLLAADGSTTLLLEAMLNTRLTLRVTSQEVVSADGVDPMARDLLGGPGPFLNRRSALHAPSGAQVSENLVVAPAASNELAGVLRHPTQPIGHGLINLGLSTARRIIASGRTAWTTTATCCAFKAYLVESDGRPAAYIHERFNPRSVPVQCP